MDSITKIKDLKLHMRNLTLIVKVISKSDVAVYYGDERASAIVEDETGKIKVNLWHDQVEQTKVGKTIRITGAFVHGRSKYLQISTWSKFKATGQ